VKLKNAEINPGRLCNNRCVFCMSGDERDRHDPWVSLEAVKDELRRCYEDGARSAGFLGGEPSVYPHLLPAVSRARELGYQRIALCTNGVRLADARFLNRLAEAGLTRVTVSVHSREPSVEERLTGVPGILQKKLKALRNLMKLRRSGMLKDNVSLNPVLCRPNMKDIEGFIRFFAAEGIDDFRFNFIWPQGRARTDKRVVPEFREAVPWMLKALTLNEREWKLHLSFGGVPFCVLPAAFQKRWLVLKKYFFEEGLDLPTDVAFLRPKGRGESERFNWQERSKDEYRGYVPACASCGFQDRCMGIYRTYLELYGDDAFGC